MTSFDPSSDELVSAYIDGEATAAEVALVEADPTLLARVAHYRAIAEVVASPPPAPSAEAREAAIAAALGASTTSKKVTSLAPIQQRRSRFANQKAMVLSAAAVLLVLFLGVAVVSNLSGNDSQDTASAGDATSDAAETDSEDTGRLTTESADMADDDDRSIAGSSAAAESGLDAAGEDEAMEDEAMEEEAMEEEAEEEAMEEEPDALFADDAVTEEAASDTPADEPTASTIRSFGSLEELLATVSAEQDNRQQQAPETPAVTSPDTLAKIEQCRADDGLNTNSLVFVEAAVLRDTTANGDDASIDVLIYRDELLDTTAFIQVFDAADCSRIQ